MNTMRAPFAGSYDPKEFNAARAVETNFWFGDELSAQVGFDHGGVVVWKGAWMAPVPRQRADSIREKLARWIGF